MNQTLGQKLFRTKPIVAGSAADGRVHGEAGLQRSLGLFSLTMIGVGATIGTGIFFTMVEAVPKAGAGKAAVAENGEVEIPATAQLAFETSKAEAEAGSLKIASPNPSGTPHNIALEGDGIDEKGEVVQDGGVSFVTADVKPGRYTFYCSVPGHREGGMEGTLTVK